MTDMNLASFNKLVPGFDFLQGLVKNAGQALPSIGQWLAPTLNPEELEKRIEELRTVQFWLEQNARMLGASQKQLLRHVYLPSATSWVFSSLHTSVGLAFVGAVVGEYLGSSQGVGYLILQAEGSFDINTVMAGIVVLTAFALLLDAAVTVIEKRLMKWQPRSGETEKL